MIDTQKVQKICVWNNQKRRQQTFVIAVLVTAVVFFFWENWCAAVLIIFWIQLLCASFYFSIFAPSIDWPMNWPRFLENTRFPKIFERWRYYKCQNLDPSRKTPKLFHNTFISTSLFPNQYTHSKTKIWKIMWKIHFFVNWNWNPEHRYCLSIPFYIWH